MYHHCHHPKYIGPLVVAFPSLCEYSFKFSSFVCCLLFIYYFCNKCTFNVPPLWRPMFCTAAWYKHFTIILFLSGFQTSILVCKFQTIYALATQIWVFLSTIWHDFEVGPLPLNLANWARNALISSSCMTIVVVSSHAVSNNHNCVLHFSVELPVSASVTLE